ncbi:MAG: TolC family protein [Gemmatimonadales bacterium]
MRHASTVGALVCCALVSGPLRAQGGARSLTLDQAQALALQHNTGLAAVRKQVEEAQRKSAIASSYYLPRVQTQGLYLASNNTQGILVPRGSLGYFADFGGVFPPTDRNITQGGPDLFFALTTVVQPVTQYFKIREGVGAAHADEDAGRAGLRKAEQDVAFGVLQAYAGVLIATRHRDVARERVAADSMRVADQVAAVQSGSANAIVAQEARVQLLQGRQELLAAEGEYDDVSYALTDATGLPPGTALALEVPPPEPAQPASSSVDYVESALRSNPDVLEAKALVDKTTHGVRAAKAEYIPDVGVVGGNLYQSSVPFFPRSTFAIGAQGSWTILDFGARRDAVEVSKAQLGQAQLNFDRVKGRVRGEVESAYRRVTRAQQTVELATEAVALGTEASRLGTAAASAGYALATRARAANADRLEAEMNLLKAQLGYRVALAELEKAAGTLKP